MTVSWHTINFWGPAVGITLGILIVALITYRFERDIVLVRITALTVSSVIMFAIYVSGILPLKFFNHFNRGPFSVSFGGFVVLSVSLAARILRHLGESTFVARPPGAWLLKLVDNVCRKSTADLIGQMVADMQVEHFEALKDGRRWKARWIIVLHIVAMLRALSIDRLLAAVLDYVIGAIRRG